MSKKLTVKKRKKRVKERPFDDSDTVIQFREDFVQDYIREPLMRKATEEPVVERVVTETMEKDLGVDDEDDDIGVRTREKTLPEMPLELEFMAGMQNSVETTLLMDVRDALRFYNDALRNPGTIEMAKVFLFGVIRQLRYWAQTQTLQTDVPEGCTALDWVVETLCPRIEADMSILAKHFNPEIDKVYFRRWTVEMMILKREISVRQELNETARMDLEKQGYDPLDPNAARQITLPEDNILQWITDNPEEAKIVFADETQFETLIRLAWSEIFNDDSNISYLCLLDNLQIQSQMNREQEQSFLVLMDKVSTGSSEDVQALMQDSQFASLLLEIQNSSTVLEQTSTLSILQKLLKAYTGSAQSLVEKTLDNQEPFRQLLSNLGQ